MSTKPIPNNLPNPFFDEATVKDLFEALEFAQIFSCLVGDYVKKGLFPDGQKVYEVQKKIEAVLESKDIKAEAQILTFYERQMEGGGDK